MSQTPERSKYTPFNPRWMRAFSSSTSVLIGALLESGCDALRGLMQARGEFEGALQRQAGGGGMHGDRGADLAVAEAYRHRDAGDAEHVLLVVDRIAGGDDAIELLREECAIGERVRGEARERQVGEECLALGRGAQGE